MSSSHEFALTQAATALTSKDPRWAVLMAGVCAKLNSKFYDQLHVDAIMQQPNGLFDLYDAFAFLHVHSLIRGGTFLVIDIPIPQGPSRDKSVRRNGETLRMLDRRFNAEFRGGFGDSDGFLSWDDELEVASDSSSKPVRLHPQRLPLEVGFTNASRTLAHLTQEGGLARWPYGHELIRAFVRADDVEVIQESVSGIQKL